MRFLRDVSLKRKLMVIIMLTSTAALLLACAAFVTYEVSEFRKDMVDDLTVKAEVLGSQSTASLRFNDPKAAKEILDKLAAEKHIVAACIYTRDGKVLARYAGPGAGPFTPPEPQFNRSAFEKDHVALFRAILDKQQHDAGTIYLKSDLLELD